MSPAPPSRISERERTWLLAMAMALAALGVDLILPAFAAIRADFGLAPDATDVTSLVTAYFIGMAGGQLIYGPLSDRWGRKPALQASYAVSALGALAVAAAPTLGLAVAARLLWGLGAAGQRAITMAIVRDRYSGEAMSRAMSLIFAVFILVPIVAPSLGAGLLRLVDWRVVVLACVLAAAAMAAWTTRLAESLAVEHRRTIRGRDLLAAAQQVLGNGTVVRSTLAMIALFGGFTSYIASSEIIIGDVFGMPGLFPIVFGAIAMVMGLGMLLNARLVERLGVVSLLRGSFTTYLAGATGMVLVSLLSDGRPAFLLFAAPLVLALGSHSVLMPNLNAVALEPLGHVAGMASAITGTLQIAGGAALGAVIDAAFDGTVLPISLGFLVLGLAAAGMTLSLQLRTRGAFASTAS